MSDLADLTIREAGAALRADECSSVDLLESVLRRAAFTEFNRELAQMPFDLHLTPTYRYDTGPGFPFTAH